MKQLLLTWIERIDQLGRRDRLAVVAGLLAVAIGIEALWLLPLHDRRRLIERTLQSDATARSAQHTQQQADQALRLTQLRIEAAAQAEQLSALGIQTARHDSLASLLAQGLRNEGVALTGLKGLPVEPLAPAGTNPAVAQPAAAEPAQPELFRHRAELQLEGAVGPLTRAVELLEQGLVPLRVERVRVAAAQPSGHTVRATVVLTTISRERTWLAL